LDDVFDDVALNEAEPVLKPVKPVLKVVVLRERQVAAAPLDLRLGQPRGDFGRATLRHVPVQQVSEDFNLVEPAV
jgi:hypothetical protein